MTNTDDVIVMVSTIESLGVKLRIPDTKHKSTCSDIEHVRTRKKRS